MSEKILLIDGETILYKAFYGVPDQVSLLGLHTGGIYGFLHLMVETLEREKPDYVTVILEKEKDGFCHERYGKYLKTEKAMPEILEQQIPLLKEILEAMGIYTLVLEKHSVEEALEQISEKSKEKAMEVIILSGKTETKCLASDKVQAIIPQTAAGQAVLHRYAEETEKRNPAAADAGKTDRENLPDQSAAVSIPVPDLEKARLGDIYTKEAYELCQKWNLESFLVKFDPALINEGSIEQNFFECMGTESCDAIFEKAAKKEAVGLGVLCDKEGLYAVALALEETEICYIPVERFITSGYLSEKLWNLGKTTRLCCCDVKSMLKHILLEPDTKIFDCGIAAYLLNPLKGSYPYNEIAREYLSGREFPAREELLGKISLKKAWEEELVEARNLACYMAYTALAAFHPLEERLKAEEMWEVYTQIEVPLVFTLDSMEKWGIEVKGEELKSYGEKLNVRIRELEQTIWQQAGEDFNINSPKQLGVILFEKMGIPGGKKTKTGYSTSADILEKLASEYPIVNDILEYRQLAKLKSTYADGLGAVIEADGRIHSTFNQTITATGRISSTEPNLQNIPVRMELGRLIRKVFVPAEGFVFLDADYSQIELRVLAHMSQDEKLIQAYQEAEDIHRLTASQVFHIPLEEVTPLQRRNAKAVNFGIVYGISSFGLSQDLSITRKEASAYIEQYFETYPRIKGFLDGLVEQGKEKGYVSTMFGRRRPVPELKSSNFMQRSFGERVAMNSPIQGTAADIIKIAMNRVYRRLQEEHLRSRLVLQVHDELLIETQEEEIPQVSRILEEEMKGAAKLAVELEVDMHQGNNWYEAK